jgi:hypothetical protein
MFGNRSYYMVIRFLAFPRMIRKKYITLAPPDARSYIKGVETQVYAVFFLRVSGGVFPIIITLLSVLLVLLRVFGKKYVCSN